MTTLIEPAKIARRALQISLQDRVCAAVRANPDRICRAEYAYHRTVKCDGEMHRSGIICYAYRRTPGQRCQLAESGHPGEIDRTRRQICHFFTNDALALRADQNHCASFRN